MENTNTCFKVFLEYYYQNELYYSVEIVSIIRNIKTLIEELSKAITLKVFFKSNHSELHFSSFIKQRIDSIDEDIKNLEMLVDELKAQLTKELSII